MTSAQKWWSGLQDAVDRLMLLLVQGDIPENFEAAESLDAPKYPGLIF